MPWDNWHNDDGKDPRAKLGQKMGQRSLLELSGGETFLGRPLKVNDGFQAIRTLS